REVLDARRLRDLDHDGARIEANRLQELRDASLERGPSERVGQHVEKEPTGRGTPVDLAGRALESRLPAVLLELEEAAALFRGLKECARAGERCSEWASGQRLEANRVGGTQADDGLKMCGELCLLEDVVDSHGWQGGAAMRDRRSWRIGQPGQIREGA